MCLMAIEWTFFVDNFEILFAEFQWDGRISTFVFQLAIVTCSA